MFLKDSDHSRQQSSTLLYIFECVMAILYLTLSFLFLFTNLFVDSIGGTVRILLGVLLGIYGIFRVYRALKKLFRKTE